MPGAVMDIYPLLSQTQRGATFMFNGQGELLYEHRDRGILGFADNMSQPLSFLDQVPVKV